MKRLFKGILLLTLPVAMFTTPSCSDSSDDDDNTQVTNTTHPLVGSWTSNASGYSYLVTFNADSTGTSKLISNGVEYSSLEFSWSTISNNILSISYTNGATNENSYELSGNSLTLTTYADDKITVTQTDVYTKVD